jgi:hypothetical protein
MVNIRVCFRGDRRETMEAGAEVRADVTHSQDGAGDAEEDVPAITAEGRLIPMSLTVPYSTEPYSTE